MVEELAARHHSFVVEHHIGWHEWTNDETVPGKSVRRFDPLLPKAHARIITPGIAASRRRYAPRAAGVCTDTLLCVLVELSEYDPRWASRFEAERSRIVDALGPLALSIDHVGSTSVPFLAAKPTIDIVLTVTDSTDENSYVPALERCGLEFVLREPDWFEHRLLRRAPRLVNLHIFTDGCSEVAQMIGFRDWLRDHADDRAVYERTKRALATRRWDVMQDYADAKTDIVAEIKERAGLAESGGR